MKESTRNLIVGLTVMAALGIFAVMTLVFQDLPTFFQLGYAVRVEFPDTGGVNKGADVTVAGKRIGRVSDISFVDPADPAKGVVFILSIDRDVNLRGNVNFYTGAKGIIGGGGGIEVREDNRPPGTLRKAPGTNQPLAMIPRDNSVIFQGGQAEPGAGGLIPPDMLADVKETVKNINTLAKSLDTFFTLPPENSSAPTSQPAIPNIYVTLSKFNRALDNTNLIVGDKANQDNIKASLEDLHKLTGQLVADAGQLGKLLSTINAAFIKIDKGEGTLGKLLNDPGLYNAMTDATTALKGVMKQLAELAEQWKRQGLSVKLK